LPGFQEFGVRFVVAALGGGGDAVVGISGGGFREHLIEHRGFDSLDPAKSPAGRGHLPGEEKFVLVGGLKLVAKTGEDGECSGGFGNLSGGGGHVFLLAPHIYQAKSKKRFGARVKIWG
jgi:hypothetical protein